MIVSNALVKVGHCQVNYNHSPRSMHVAGGFAFVALNSGAIRCFIAVYCLNFRARKIPAKICKNEIGFFGRQDELSRRACLLVFDQTNAKVSNLKLRLHLE
jgi:hypothetical protein